MSTTAAFKQFFLTDRYQKGDLVYYAGDYYWCQPLQFSCYLYRKKEDLGLRHLAAHQGVALRAILPAAEVSKAHYLQNDNPS